MGSAIRGSRVGAGPMGEAERGEAIARFRISYWCANGHETKPSFAEDETVEILFSCSFYETRKKWVNEMENEEILDEIRFLINNHIYIAT